MLPTISNSNIGLGLLIPTIFKDVSTNNVHGPIVVFFVIFTSPSTSNFALGGNVIPIPTLLSYTIPSVIDTHCVL